MAARIDINCDMGESFGIYSLGVDEQIIKHITSANIACGFHAGDPSVMRKTVSLAVEHGVNIGAHPSYPDRVGFGRRPMALSYSEVRDDMVYQIGALMGFANALGTRVKHFKAHGAIVNSAATDPVLARALADAVRELDRDMIFVAANPELAKAGVLAGLRVAYEVYADRGYMPDGTLVPRSMPGAMVTDEAAIAPRVARMVKEGVVLANDGTIIQIRAHTVCVHGDTPGADRFAKSIREELVRNGVEVAPLDTIV